MSRPAWQIQQRTIQQRQNAQSFRRHQEGIAYIREQERRRHRKYGGYNGGSGLGTAFFGVGLGAVIGGPVGAVIGGGIGWIVAKLS